MKKISTGTIVRMITWTWMFMFIGHWIFGDDPIKQHEAFVAWVVTACCSLLYDKLDKMDKSTSH